MPKSKLCIPGRREGTRRGIGGGGGHFAHWESSASGAAQLGCITSISVTSISASYCSITKQRADSGFSETLLSYSAFNYTHIEIRN